MIHRIKNENNEEKFLVVGVFGEQITYDYHDGQPEIDVKEGAELYREFNTFDEGNAYILGLNDMLGWHDCTVGESLEYHKKIFGKITER